jgi:hypothetical protein
MGASPDGDRACRPTAQAPTGLGDSATIPCAAWRPIEEAPDEHYVWLLYDFPKYGPTPVLGILKNDPQLKGGGQSWFGPETIMWNGRPTQGTWIEAWIRGWRRFCDHSSAISEARGFARWVSDSDTRARPGDAND